VSYVKPKLPTGFLVFIFEDRGGTWDGPFDGRLLEPVQNDPDGAWVLLSDGAPRVLRVTEQEGDVLRLEDCGRVRIQPVRRVGDRFVDAEWHGPKSPFHNAPAP
jgi:hypothetical protein